MREKIASWWDESKGCLVFAVCAALVLFLLTYCGDRSAERAEKARDEAYHEGYDEGYDAGHWDGYEEGHEVGYDEGYNDGVADGKDLSGAGIDDGIEEYSIRWMRVNSTAFYKVGYDADNEILGVTFHESGTYFYYNVPAEVYQEFIAADSLGSYFNEHIKGTYAYVKDE